MLYKTIQHYIRLYDTIQRYTTLYKTIQQYIKLYNTIRTIYNMSGRVVSDIQTRAEGESLYIRYNTDAKYPIQHGRKT